jgi:hypothetical protein
MTRSFRALILLTTEFAPGCEPALRDFVALGDGFAVKLPGNPVRGIQKAQTQMGPLEYRPYSIKHGSTEYVVTANKLPQTMWMGPFTPGPRERLAGAVRGSLQNGGTLTEQKQVELQGHPGKCFTIDVPESKMPSGGTLRARVYVVGRRFYQVAIVAPKGKFPQGKARQVFDSSALLDAQGKPIQPSEIAATPPPVATTPAPVTAATARPESPGGRFARPTAP